LYAPFSGSALLNAFSLSYGENPIFHIIVKAQASPVFYIAFGVDLAGFSTKGFFCLKKV